MTDTSYHSVRDEQQFQSTLSSRRVTQKSVNPFIFLTFQSTLSSRRVTASCRSHRSPGQFQSTPSSRRVTHLLRYKIVHYTISIHTLLAESDRKPGALDPGIRRFQSTPSSRRVTHRWPFVLHHRHISIHTLLAESDSRLYKVSSRNIISIHTLLAESDLMRSGRFWKIL